MITLKFSSNDFNLSESENSKSIIGKKPAMFSKTIFQAKKCLEQGSIELAFFRSCLILTFVAVCPVFLLDFYASGKLPYVNAVLLVVLMSGYQAAKRVKFGNLATIVILLLDLILIAKKFDTPANTTITVGMNMLGLITSVTLTGKIRKWMLALVFCSLCIILSSELIIRTAKVPDFQLFRDGFAHVLYFIMIVTCAAILKNKYKKQEASLKDLNTQLDQKTTMIRHQHVKLLENHEKLEGLVKMKTMKIEKKNHQLLELSYTNAHKVRAPLARILGLINLIDLDPDKKDLYLKTLASEALLMDEIVRSVGKAIEESIES
jgi:signal transduction histidine kinase